MGKLAAKLISLLLIVSSLAFAGCNNGQKPNIQDINIALQHEPYKLDPYYAETKAEMQVYQSIFDKLVSVDDKGNIVPELADSWNISNDGKVYTFCLHKNITFHDGTPFNAEAVKFNLERYQGSSQHRALQVVNDIEILDDYTVKLILEKPFTPLLYVLADKSGMMCSPSAVRSHGVQFMNSPIGTGPYIFKTRVRGNSVSLSANPHYWRKNQPMADNLTYKIIPNEKTALVNLRSGMIDFCERFPVDEIKNYQNHEKILVNNALGIDFTGLVFNLNQKPLHDLKVRKAISLLIDEKEIIEKSLNDTAVFSCKPFILPKTDDVVKQNSVVNVQRAQELLKEAGYAEGFTLTLELDTNPVSLEVAKSLQHMLRRGNIDLEYAKQDITALLRRMDRKEYQVALLHIEGHFDQDQNLYERFHTNGKLNYMYYSNRTVDRLLDEARCTPNSFKREHMYTLVKEQLALDIPYIYLYHENNIQGMSKRLQGVQVMPDGMLKTSCLHK